MHICLIDSSQVAIVLRGSHDIMLTFTVDKQRKILYCHPFDEEHVTSLLASNNYVFIGYQHGSFLRVPKKHFLRGKLNKNSTPIVINQSRPTSAMLVGSDKLIISNDKYLYQYPLDFVSDRGGQIEKAHKEQPVREIIISYDKKKFFVSFQCNPEIYIYDFVNLSRLCEYNCGEIVTDIFPGADNNDTRVTCMCSVLDVLWVGTGSGHILIFEDDGEKNRLNILVSFKPYKLEMRKFCLVEVDDASFNDVKYLMVTSGSIRNENMFGENSLCTFNGDFPLDEAYVDRGFGKERLSPQGIIMKDEHDCTGKIILMWQVLSAKRLRNLQAIA